MTDEVWRRSGIESPCVKICMIHPEAGLCAGCLRTRDEIAMWSRYSDAERAEIMEALPERRARLVRRRGGRQGRLHRKE